MLGLTIALILMAVMLVLGLMPSALWARPARSREITQLRPAKVAVSGTMLVAEQDCAAA